MKKIKMKYLKKEHRYLIDFRKHEDIESIRYNVLEALNEKYDFAIFIDTAYGKHLDATREDYYDLMEEGSRRDVLSVLEDNELRYEMQMKKGQETVKVFGLAVGQSKTVLKPRLGVYIDKGGLNKELFKYIMSTHDYTLGLGLQKDVDAILASFTDGDYTVIDFKNEGDDFEEILIDSRMVERFLTTMDLSAYFEE